MRVEVVAWRTASGDAKATAEGDACRFKMPFCERAVLPGMEYLQV
jgi:hypothetical protein